jgi:hypothetical protein
MTDATAHASAGAGPLGVARKDRGSNQKSPNGKEDTELLRKVLLRSLGKWNGSTMR